MMLVRAGAKYLRFLMLRRQMQREEKSIRGPLYGSAAWVHKVLDAEQVRERGARHALERFVMGLAQRVSRLEGRSDSGEQRRVSFEADTEQDPLPPWPDEEPRTPAETPRARRRSRP